jgi:hypothetical protein
MAVATISVNFATLGDVQSGTSTVTSINPAILKNSLQSGSSLYNLTINGLTTQGAILSNSTISCTGEITAFSSDSRLKVITGKITNALDKLNTISGIYYKHSDVAKSFGFNDDNIRVGVIAQDVEAVLPEAVRPAPFDLNEDGSSKSGEKYLTVQYEKLVPLLIEAVKELATAGNDIVKRLEALEANRGN